MQQVVAVYGGTFDPITVGHVAAVKAVRKALDIPVWVCPVANHPWGKKPLNFATRAMLCEMALGGDSKVSVSNYELWNPTGLTYNLLRLIGRLNPGVKLRPVIGDADAAKMNTWEKGEELMREYDWIVLPRAHDEDIGPAQWYEKAPHDYLREHQLPRASSTEIRIALKNGSSKADHLLPDGVREFVHKSYLYRL